jgi:DNA-binding NarL/FixJ family response regulator
MTRLLIFAPAPVARAGWRALLAGAPNLDIVADAGVTVDLVAQVAHVRPDVALLDPAADDDAFLPALRALTAAHPGLRAVVLGEARAGAAAEALGAGARAYLRVAASGEEVIAAIAAVERGLIVVDPAVAGSLLDRLTGTATAPLPTPAAVPALTGREMEVLQLLAAGLTTRGIARQLGVSEHTAKFHIGSILTKFDAGSRAEAVAVAARAGLLLQ